MTSFLKRLPTAAKIGSNIFLVLIVLPISISLVKGNAPGPAATSSPEAAISQATPLPTATPVVVRNVASHTTEPSPVATPAATPIFIRQPHATPTTAPTAAPALRATSTAAIPTLEPIATPAPTPRLTPTPLRTATPTAIPTPVPTEKITPKPTLSQSACDPNYSGACVPIASDVDCLGGSGNGPAYVKGPVHVIGVDIYHLDSDGDGIGCE